MKKELKLSLKNCYGIKELSETFDFSKKNAFLIYASNGTMKTSFIKTFEDFSKNQDSSDLVFNEITERSIKYYIDEKEEEIQDDIIIINSYKEDYNTEESIKFLLINENLKQEYNNLIKGIKQKEKELLSIFKSYFNIKKDDKFSEMLFKLYEEKSLYAVLIKVIKEEFNKKYLDIDYNKIFNEQVINFLKEKDVNYGINDYVFLYQKLTRESNLFNINYDLKLAEKFINDFEDTGFFDNQKLIVNEKTIKSMEEYKKLTLEEKNKILENKDLQDKFDVIKSKIKNKNSELFIKYISENTWLISELNDINELEKKFFNSVLLKEKIKIEEYIKDYLEIESKKEEIKIKANEDKKSWEKVVRVFNERFFVPFEVKIKNEDEVFENNAIPEVEFEFRNENETRVFKEKEVVNFLSQGEKRALYILNILFKIEEEKLKNSVSLNDKFIIIDDISDSFDYKNKYAIIEYLNEIKEVELFNLVILSHNFDFHRTAMKKLNIRGEQELFAIKDNKTKKIRLSKKTFSMNPLINLKNIVFKSNGEGSSDSSYLISLLPFVRNLAEYRDDKEEVNSDYKVLTDLLHYKKSSEDKSFQDLFGIFKRAFNLKDNKKINNNKYIYREIVNECIRITKDSDKRVYSPKSTNILNDKLILSIGMRIEAEKFMIKKIDNDDFVDKIKENQYTELLNKYCNCFKNEIDNVNLLKTIKIISSESIHLNSFAYESIIDMDINILVLKFKEIHEKNKF